MLLTVYLLFTGLHVSEGCTLVNSEKPIQTITARTGGSVLLPCYCTDLQTKPVEFTWRKENAKNNNRNDISINSDQYRNRVQLVNDHSPGNLSLLISHLTEEDGGVYQCAVKDSHINIRLALKEGPPSTTSSTAVVNVHTHPTPSTTPSTEKTNGHYIYSFTFIPVLLLLLGIGGVIYWRCRGRRGGESTKTHQKSQDEVTYSTVVHSRTPGTSPIVTDLGEKSEYATIRVNE